MRRFGMALCAWALLFAPAWSQVTVSEGTTAGEVPEVIEIEVAVHSIEVPGITKDLRIVAFEALSIGRETKYMIFLPDGYDDSEQRYPVLYMLHGFSQNYTVWPMMGVSEYLDTYNDVIIVMPDVGNSWYINWVESDNDELVAADEQATPAGLCPECRSGRLKPDGDKLICGTCGLIIDA